MHKNLPHINSAPASFKTEITLKNLTSKSRNPSGKAFSDGNGPLTFHYKANYSCINERIPPIENISIVVRPSVMSTLKTHSLC